MSRRTRPLLGRLRPWLLAVVSALVVLAGVRLWLRIRDGWDLATDTHAFIGMIAIVAHIVLLTAVCWLLRSPQWRLGVRGPLAVLLGAASPAAVLLVYDLAELNPTGHDARDAFLAGFGEEASKLLAVLFVLLLIRRPRHGVRPLEGLLVGFLVGGGFALMENVAYLLDSEEEDAVFISAGRLVLGLGGHELFTALTGLGLAVVLCAGTRGWKLGVLGLVSGPLLHSMWDLCAITMTSDNAILSLVLLLLLQATTVLLFVLARIWSGRMDRRIPLLWTP